MTYFSLGLLNEVLVPFHTSGNFSVVRRVGSRQRPRRIKHKRSSVSIIQVVVYACLDLQLSAMRHVDSRMLNLQL